MDKIIKKFNLQGKQFFLTYPQCTATKEELLAFLKAKHDLELYRICRELHQDGTPHLHVYCAFRTKIRTTAADYFDFNGFHGNYQTVRSKIASLKYIGKHGDFIENFKLEAKVDSMLTKKRDISRELMSGRPLCAVTDENPELLFGYKKLKQDLEQYQLDKSTIPKIYPRECYWVFGSPGIGKSYWVRSNYPELYEKAQNKWWDGYNNEDVVLLDDLDSDALGHMLKIWADGYSFLAETKGGTFRPKYTKLYVTSNYMPSDLFKNSILVDAISRRFKFKTIDNYSLIDI